MKVLGFMKVHSSGEIRFSDSERVNNNVYRKIYTKRTKIRIGRKIIGQIRVLSSILLEALCFQFRIVRR